MPYITKDKRERFDPELKPIVDLLVEDQENVAGNLNYLITALLVRFSEQTGKKKYKDLNELIGALECCKTEFYRVFIAPYEDQKSKENGPIS